MRNKPWKSLEKKLKKLSTTKSANKTTEYRNVSLRMRAHRINWRIMPFKRVQLITSDSIPHLHRNELSQKESNLVIILKEYAK